MFKCYVRETMFFRDSDNGQAISAFKKNFKTPTLLIYDIEDESHPISQVEISS